MKTRRGMGKGLGCGYKNLMPKDSYIHGLSAKGVVTYRKTKSGKSVRVGTNADGTKNYLFLNAMHYSQSEQFRNANPKDYMQFVGLKSKDYEGRPFVIDEHDAKMIVANIPKKDYETFKKEFQDRSASSFRVLQDFDFRKNGDKRTISDVRAKNERIGHHFFDRGSMRFFDSRVETKGNLIKNKFFVTSEQFHGSDGYSAPRKYTVREAKPDGDIDTKGEFNSFRTKAEAVAYAKTLNAKRR